MLVASSKVALLAAALLAQAGGGAPPSSRVMDDNDSYKLPGTYAYASAQESPDGHPTCAERWILGARGDFRIESGQEVVSGSWRKMRDEGGVVWIRLGGLKSNGLEDCTGQRSTKPIPDRRVDFYVNAAAGLVVTKQVQVAGGGPWVPEPVGVLKPEDADPFVHVRP